MTLGGDHGHTINYLLIFITRTHTEVMFLCIRIASCLSAFRGLCGCSVLDGMDGIYAELYR